ncbi:LPS export ABC transporter periplasmic protein LptC [Candidatus Kinetoplastidibacterium crithidiae]|uniref:LPS export ABC transporter periplasmic protein LptC n=1 Tax=Candidatus Kinetoplastidibacterium crithidiae TaxID=33056 RepID=UPI0002A117A6|nr:LPS export ABC transporter periplasmic protein LptC [Candidatus Kinetoplastibacterium crithidii]AFZ82930.1 hypothetical protein CKCE_0507 [Candidatus Kinetoplastibacterium crithidii (ex Angomonas deanei ATCC 30255)]
MAATRTLMIILLLISWSLLSEYNRIETEEKNCKQKAVGTNFKIIKTDSEGHIKKVLTGDSITQINNKDIEAIKPNINISKRS